MLSQYRLPLEERVPLFAPLLALPLPEHHYPPLNLSPQRQRQKTLETIVAILLELAERQPVLFILEDLHWTDPTTLELLNLLIDQLPTAPMLVLLTYRPHFQPAWHHRSYITERSYWIPGSWHLRIVYTDESHAAIPHRSPTLHVNIKHLVDDVQCYQRPSASCAGPTALRAPLVSRNMA